MVMVLDGWPSLLQNSMAQKMPWTGLPQLRQWWTAWLMGVVGIPQRSLEAQVSFMVRGQGRQ